MVLFLGRPVLNLVPPDIGNPSNMKKLRENIHIRRSRRFLLTLLGFGCLFFFLGVGNVLVGMYKSHEYSSSLQQARYEILHVEKPVIPLVDGGINIDSQTKHISRLESRLDYYNLVTLGGKVFLAISGALLLICLLVRPGNEDGLPLVEHEEDFPSAN